MRFALVPILFLIAGSSYAADDAVEATRKIGGRTARFPAGSIEAGVNAVVGAVQSCSSKNDDTLLYTVNDLRKAQERDHVRMVFSKTVTVTVVGEKMEVSELVFAAGVFWVRVGEKVRRCTKYEHEKMKVFEEWYRQPLSAR
ncbi:MAG: hypothetical protein ACJ8F7_10790 [Gemmataceae bacterium]